MEELQLNDIAKDLFIMNKYTVDKLFSADNPADVFALYGFYYKTAKWQETNIIKANDKYIKLCLKWGITRIQSAKKELLSLGLIETIQRRKNGKVEGWYIKISYIVSESKLNITVDNSNNTQKQQVAEATSSNQDTNALKQKLNTAEKKKLLEKEATKLYEYYKTRIKASTKRQSCINNISTWLKDYKYVNIASSIYNYSLVSKQQKDKKYIKDCSNFFGTSGDSKGFFKDYLTSETTNEIIEEKKPKYRPCDANGNLL